MKIKYIFVLSLTLFSQVLVSCTDAQPGEIALASQLNSQGQPISPSNSFARGDTIFLSIELLDAYEGLGMSATWKFGDQILETDQITASRKATTLNPLFVSASLETRVDWPAGAYSCDVFIPDHGIKTIEFTLNQGEQ